jgi:RNA polymerase sigma-70 factor, ECF subfamily
VLLEDQDRSRWDAARIAEGTALVDRALAARRPGQYQIQAAIAAVHDAALTPDATDWREIVALYRALLAFVPTPVVELNLAVAVAMSDGPAFGLAMMDALFDDGALASYPYLHAGRADLLRRLGRWSEAIDAYGRALDLTENSPERDFLERRIGEMHESASRGSRLD